jgi:hypothetical protein
VKFVTRTHRVLGRVRVPVGFCKWVSFGGFQGFFRFLSGFEFFFGVFRLLSVSGFFGFRVFLGFFWVSGAPMGKMERTPKPGSTRVGFGSRM